MKTLTVQPLLKRTRWKNIFFYALRNRPSLWLFALALIVAIVYSVCAETASPFQELSSQWHEMPAGTMFQATMLLAAVSIWVFQVVQEWKNELPKYISVDFLYRGQPRIRCQYASVVGESDVRGMAQSLGQAVNHGKRLPIAPTLDNVNKAEMWDISGNINKGRPFLHYHVEIRMTDNITDLGVDPHQKKTRQKTPDNAVGKTGKDQQHEEGTTQPRASRLLARIPEDKFICWTWPFEPPTEDDLRPCND